MGAPELVTGAVSGATKRADTLRKKGKEVDFQEILKMEPDGNMVLYINGLADPSKAVAQKVFSPPFLC
ncbi:hypothetical protein [Rhizobium mongolense]